MVTKESNEELYNAEVEIEELSIQLADMLGVALYFAGVPKDMMQDAVDAYLDGLDEYFGDDDEAEMGFDQIVAVIEKLKETKPVLFVSK
jgi:hypothetical protein